MTDTATQPYYDDDSYEDDFTDDEEEDRGSSKGPTLNNNPPPIKKRNAFAGSTRQSSIRSDRRNMSRRGEGRVKSSKRRQQNNVRNQMAQLTVNYDELLRENKILKQIQKRQERELDKYNNADEDIPRLLDANSYEIAGLKAKNKQLLFEKREMDDKLRRQHQEIMSLKDQSKKLNSLINNKKLGEREKLEMELTTARVTIAHQENKIQDLTKATEIYKKTADRESRGGQVQLRKAQNNLRDLQDAYNELFLKYKVKEREAGNNNIYAQRARQPSKRSRRPGGDSLERSEAPSTNPTTSKSSLLTTGEEIRSKIEVASPRGRRISKESPLKSGSLERLEAELNALDRHEEALNSDSDIPEEEKEKEKPVVEMVNKPRTKSPSTFSSDSEEETPVPSKPKVEQKPSPVRDTGAEERRIAEEKRLKQEEEAEKKRKAEAERLKEIERIRNAEEAERKKQEEADRAAAEVKLKEDAVRKAKEDEEEKKRKEEEKLLDEKRRKDNEMKDKLAAMRANAGGDFMSQLKAKRNTPSISPSSSPVKSEGPKSPAAAPAPITTTAPTVERTARKSDSGDELRKAAVTNNVNGGRRKKSIEDYSIGYQPSFAPAPRAGKRDPFGVESTEYTPSFSANQRISRESVRDKVWTPAGRASTSEKNGLFDSQRGSIDQSKPLLKRRPSKSKNNIGSARVQSDEDLEELIL